MKKNNIKKCYLCGATKFERVKGKVRDLPETPILRCDQCGLVFLATSGHIGDDFYENSRMREGQEIKSWRAYLQECARDDERRAKWLEPSISGKAVLDFGCGGGGFLSRVKHSAGKCVGIEKDKSLRLVIKKNFKIAIYSDIDEVKDKFDFITMFHVLEHFKDPKQVLIRLSRLLTDSGRIIAEVPNVDDALLSLYESKAFSEFTYWGCHLYLFNVATLKKLITCTGLSVDYIKQIQRYPLSNHLFWLAKGKPGGHKIWDFLDGKVLDSEYEAALSKQNMCDTIIISASKKKRRK
jgi:2-polyprenyl-3-methyl-5-hydroxy-6-metoxy-1,4-benzoquinol methylase